ncbi:MAG TPA: hypothetical protein VNG12_06940, partial [Acidimicrobiales bacterium]|nr:hypothetical protein [Acidimicrobiales bacterium]
VLRHCRHSDSAPPFPATVERFLASFRRVCDDPTQVVVHEISVGQARWTLGRRADVMAVSPLP